MKVSLIAQTRLEIGTNESDIYTSLALQGTSMARREYDVSSWTDSQADFLAEYAGRLCYKSFDLPNPDTYLNKDYLYRTLWRQNHWSIAEHASFTFLLEHVSRSLLTEITRHRHLSFSVVSMRYVDYNDTTPVYPPAATESEKFRIDYIYEQALNHYNQAVRVYTEQGYKRKEAREAARALLPNCAPVDMVVTGNARAWKEFLDKRDSPQADQEIQRLAYLLKGILIKNAPNIFQGLTKENNEP